MVLKCEFWKKKRFIFVNRFIESHSRAIKIKKNIMRMKISFNCWDIDQVTSTCLMDFLGKTCRSKNGKHEQYHHSVHLPPFCRGGGGGLSLQPNFQKGGGGLIGPQLSEGGCWERGGDFFQGGCSFHIKNKLKSEIFNDKKVYEQRYFTLS